MATKREKKEEIRKKIVMSAEIYGRRLAGKTFLYAYNDTFFEVVFPIDHFQHLTGVETTLGKRDFYQKSKRRQLTHKQFYFSTRYSYANAKKKLPCLIRLPELTTEMVCILKDMHTQTVIYKLSLTNLEFTLGLTPHSSGDQELFYPMSLRVNDKSVEKSTDGDIVDFIFSKDEGLVLYDELLVWDKSKKIPGSIKPLITKELLDRIEGGGE